MPIKSAKRDRQTPIATPLSPPQRQQFDHLLIKSHAEDVIVIRPILHDTAQPSRTGRLGIYPWRGAGNVRTSLSTGCGFLWPLEFGREALKWLTFSVIA
jgi:hypothetical protein